MMDIKENYSLKKYNSFNIDVVLERVYSNKFS